MSLECDAMALKIRQTIANKFLACNAALAHFRSDQSGNVAMVFGLMAIVLMVAIGAAIDIGRWLHARDQTVTAVDAAVLAGGRQLQITPIQPPPSPQRRSSILRI
jgi:Flp pilus assembly protein TadG